MRIYNPTTGQRISYIDKNNRNTPFPTDRVIEVNEKYGEELLSQHSFLRNLDNIKYSPDYYELQRSKQRLSYRLKQFGFNAYRFVFRKSECN